MTRLTTNNLTKRLRVWVLVVAFILLIPLLGQAPWTLTDFIFSGVVLLGLATTYELAISHMTNKVQRIIIGFAVLMVLMLIWAWAVA